MSANEKLGYQYTIKNVLLSLLLGIIFISGAVLAFVFLFLPGKRGGLFPPTVPEIAMLIFGVLGIVIVAAAVKGAINAALLKSAHEGTGTYLRHEERKGNEGIEGQYRGQSAYWWVYYSYTDENGKYREAKFFSDNIHDVLALQHIGSFPIKFCGGRSEIAADRTFLNQYQPPLEETGNVDTEMEQEEQQAGESGADESQNECRITSLKRTLITLNISFGVMMIAAIAGTMILYGGEIAIENISILGVVLIVAAVLGLLGIIITNVVWKVTNTVAGVKSIVTEIKNR